MNIDQQGLHELMLITTEQIDSAFNIWMSATFAVLVAVHLVGSNLKRRVLVVIATMYSLFSLLYLCRIVDSGSLAIMYGTEIAVELPFGFWNGVVRLLIFAIGTAATLYFIFRSSKEYRT